MTAKTHPAPASISRREFLKLGGLALTALGAGSAINRLTPQASQSTEQIEITRILQGKVQVNSLDTSLLYHDLQLHPLDGSRFTALQPLRLDQVPTQSYLLDLAYLALITIPVYLGLEASHGFRSSRLQKWERLALSAVLGWAISSGVSGYLDLGMNQLAGKLVGEGPIQGSLATRYPFSAFTFWLNWPFFITRAELDAPARSSEMVSTSTGEPALEIHAFPVVLETQGGDLEQSTLHVVRLLHPEKAQASLYSAGNFSRQQGKIILSARPQHLIHAAGLNPAQIVGHHDSFTRARPKPENPRQLDQLQQNLYRLEQQVRLTTLHTGPDVLVLHQDQQAIAGMTLTWASVPAISYADTIELQRRPAPVEYMALASKVGLWASGWNAFFTPSDLQQDLLTHRQIYWDYFTGLSTEEFAPDDPTTQRALWIEADGAVQALPAAQAVQELQAIAERDPARLHRVDLVRPGCVVAPGERPRGRVELSPSAKSAINYAVIKDNRVAGFVTLKGAMRFDYAVAVPLVQRALSHAGLDWDYLVEGDEHSNNGVFYSSPA